MRTKAAKRTRRTSRAAGTNLLFFSSIHLFENLFTITPPFTLSTGGTKKVPRVPMRKGRSKIPKKNGTFC
jgi:hypothetical protein